MRDQDWTKILDWPGYRVYRHEINEKAKTLRLWVRRKSGNQKLVCSGCGQRAPRIHGIYEREVRDLPWSQYQATVVIELYRVDCPDCGVKAEKIEALPSKAPFSQRFEDAVGQACESAPVRRVARQFALPESTVRAIDLRYLERWAKRRRKPVLRQMGVDEIYLGKSQKFLTVVSNLQSGEPLWFGWERKRETLDRFFETEVRRAEFFRKGGSARELIKGKHWLLLTRWVNLTRGKKQMLQQLLRLNRRLMKAYLLKESLDRLWAYRYPGAMMRYLQQWMDQLRWQRLQPMEKLANMLVKHLNGILNYCTNKIPFGVVEAINGNIKAILRRGRGYRDMNYLLLKAQRLAATKTEFFTFEKAA